MTCSVPSSIDLYALLELPDRQKSTIAHIKKAFHRLALKHHPDKQQDQTSESTALYLQISKAYQVLANEDSRAYYDLTGQIKGDDPSVSDQCTWTAFFKGETPINADTIDQIQRQYCNSSEERRDLLAFYCEFKGSVAKIFECLMFSQLESLPRYREIVMKAVEAGEVEKFDRFFTWKENAKAAKKRKVEEREAKSDLEALSRAIAVRAEQRNNDFLQRLEAKYSNASKKGKKCKVE